MEKDAEQTLHRFGLAQATFLLVAQLPALSAEAFLHFGGWR
jgi:hypothetical protein